MRVSHYYIIFSLFLYSCSLTTKIDSGFEAYERKQYSVAASMLVDEYGNTNDERSKAEIAYFLGKSFTYLNNTESSKNWFSKSVSHSYGPSAVRELAFAYKKLGNYKRAVEILEKLNSGSNNKDINREIYVLKEIMKWEGDVQSNTEVSLSKLSSPFSDYSPVFLNNQYVVFTSDRGDLENADIYKWTGNRFSNLYISANDGSNITQFDVLINTDANEGTAVFSQDGKEIIFTRCISGDIEDDYCQLYSSSFAEGMWLEPQRLGFQLKNVNYGHPALIEGDSVLIYSAEMESGFGGKDLYYSERLMDADSTFYWSESYIMPQTINTKGNEAFPTTHGDSLYYSSDFLAGLGGYDIFFTELKNGSWSPPINLKRPINSSEDDFGYVINPILSNKNITKGYFTSSRSGLGSDDIYSFETVINKSDEEIEITNNKEVEEVSRSVYIAVKVVQPIYKDDIIGGEIIDYISVDNAQVNFDNQVFYTSDKDGLVIHEGEVNKDYKIKGQRKDYLTDVARLSTYNVNFQGEDVITLNVKLILQPIRRNQEIVLNNIYYDYDKWNITNNARPTLDTLAMMLINNPQINIELSSHTDCRGERDYNLILSQKRAQSAVDYIVSKGINNRRLRAKGYGENNLIIDCECDKCSDEEHQKNRRTTFTILE